MRLGNRGDGGQRGWCMEYWVCICGVYWLWQYEHNIFLRDVWLTKNCTITWIQHNLSILYRYPSYQSFPSGVPSSLSTTALEYETASKYQPKHAAPTFHPPRLSRPIREIIILLAILHAFPISAFSTCSRHLQASSPARDDPFISNS